jgi:hypothetical protein
MFLFAGVYSDIASAEGDYEVIKILHSCGEIGSYEAVVIAKGSDGRPAVHKSEKPMEAWMKSLEDAMSAADASEIRALLEEDRAALVVVGMNTDAGRIEQSAVEATRMTLKQLDAQSSRPTAPFTDK